MIQKNTTNATSMFTVFAPKGQSRITSTKFDNIRQLQFAIAQGSLRQRPLHILFYDMHFLENIYLHFIVREFV